MAVVVYVLNIRIQCINTWGIINAGMKLAQESDPQPERSSLTNLAELLVVGRIACGLSLFGNPAQSVGHQLRLQTLHKRPTASSGVLSTYMPFPLQAAFDVPIVAFALVIICRHPVSAARVSLPRTFIFGSSFLSP
jgi:hypothetical protein